MSEFSVATTLTWRPGLEDSTGHWAGLRVSVDRIDQIGRIGSGCWAGWPHASAGYVDPIGQIDRTGSGCWAGWPHASAGFVVQIAAGCCCCWRQAGPHACVATTLTWRPGLEDSSGHWAGLRVSVDRIGQIDRTGSGCWAGWPHASAGYDQIDQFDRAGFGRWAGLRVSVDRIDQIDRTGSGCWAGWPHASAGYVDQIDQFDRAGFGRWAGLRVSVDRIDQIDRTGSGCWAG